MNSGLNGLPSHFSKPQNVVASTVAVGQTSATPFPVTPPPVLDLAQTWNTTSSPTALKVNVTNTASGSTSKLLDVQVGAATKFNVVSTGEIFIGDKSGGLALITSGGVGGGIAFNPQNISGRSALTVSYSGGLTVNSIGGLQWTNSSTQSFGATADTFLFRAAAATITLGWDVNNSVPDQAAPVAQTLTVQSVVAGTSNTAGADFTISGSKGTGTGAGGSIVFKTAPLGGSGTSQNALATGVTIDQNGKLTAAGGFGAGTMAAALPASLVTGFYWDSGTSVWTWRQAGGEYLGITGSGAGLISFDSTGRLAWTANVGNAHSTQDLYLTRSAAATLQHGDADAASPVAQTLTVQSVVAGTSDTAGTAWTLIGSKGTGTAASGNIIEKTGFSAKSTGTSQHTTVDRKVIVAKGKALTDATPVSLFEIALPTLSMCGGQIEATVVCTNGTDMQSFSQTITYSAVNKGGVYTKSITASTGDKSVSSGTLVNTWSLLDGTNKVTVQLSSDTSLTPSSNSFLVYYTVKNNSEQATTIL